MADANPIMNDTVIVGEVGKISSGKIERRTIGIRLAGPER
jgi:hypothetical protein